MQIPCLLLFLSSVHSLTNTDIDHIVLLVLENRSYDTTLGALEAGKMDKLPYYNESPDGTRIYSQRNTDKMSNFDPGHFIEDVTEQLYGTTDPKNLSNPTLDGFLKNAYHRADHMSSGGSVPRELALRETMDFRDETTLPTLYALAKEYTVFDRWFASVPGPTFPNRHFINCATAGGETSNRVSILGLPFKCIYDSLNENKVSWRAYQSGPFSSLALYRSMRHPKNLRRLKRFKKFLHDCREGELPSFSFVDPSLEENEHPPTDITIGDDYLKTVYRAVRNSPKWNKTLLLVTYDESGGFYDHVPPPVGVPRPDDKPLRPPVKHFDFDRLGGRVPTIVISPLVEKGRIISESPDGRIFEHSSIPATIKKMFNLPNFLSRRDAWAATFDVALTRSEPRGDCLKAEDIGRDMSEQ